MLHWLPVWLTCTMLEPLMQIRDSKGKKIATLVGSSIGSLFLLKMLVIKKLVNSNILVSCIMTNLLPSTQKIELLGKMLKQSLILLKK
ncbi:hypothetical protein Gotri_015998 [Gossypium trilobum]|uniref:Uncharacterized protein n=1 Tax=Gossypium trilobum TaxID=34281 RepID=A0A7J9E1Z9_9ROSI|nr:hypothetical protein [Gossypium trilobum]